MFRGVRPPLQAKARVLPHVIDDFPATLDRLPAVALLARRRKSLAEGTSMNRMTSNAPELVDVVEVADARGRDVPRQDGLDSESESSRSSRPSRFPAGKP